MYIYIYILHILHICMRVVYFVFFYFIHADARIYVDIHAYLNTFMPFVTSWGVIRNIERQWANQVYTEDSLLTHQPQPKAGGLGHGNPFQAPKNLVSGSKSIKAIFLRYQLQNLRWKFLFWNPHQRKNEDPSKQPGWGWWSKSWRRNLLRKKANCGLLRRPQGTGPWSRSCSQWM